MEFIHQEPGWPTLIWDTEALSSTLGAVRHRQGRLLGAMEALGFEIRSQANVRVLTDEVVSSSAIEGEQLRSEEVRSSISRRLGLEIAGLRTPSRHVEGIVEMILDATRNFENPLTEDRLFGWHAALFPTGRSGAQRILIGAWRTGDRGPMQVVSGPVGRERVHFEAPAADRLQEEMRRFLAWFNESSDLDPVLKAGVAHFWFVTVHPFADGNGRIARAIADMALSRADQSKGRFYSMSAAIERDRRAYYRELESAQRGDLDITGWLRWFLGCLDRSIKDADRSLSSIVHKARLWERMPVNARQRMVINRILDDFQGPLTTSKYAKLARCSTDTALRDITELLEHGILVRNPEGGRSTSYRLADPVG